MCLKSHIWVFYRFRTLSRPQMADFRPYMTFATTSGQDLKNPKKKDFLVILTILAKLADICSGRGWPEVAGGIIYGRKHVLPGH